MYTIGDTVTPLNKYHTHEEIIHRKKRVTKKSIPCDDDQRSEDGEFFTVSIKKDMIEDDESELYVYDA